VRHEHYLPALIALHRTSIQARERLYFWAWVLSIIRMDKEKAVIPGRDESFGFFHERQTGHPWPTVKLKSVQSIFWLP
jgi:hypothetical protein